MSEAGEYPQEQSCRQQTRSVESTQNWQGEKHLEAGKKKKKKKKRHFRVRVRKEGKRLRGRRQNK